MAYSVGSIPSGAGRPLTALRALPDGEPKIQGQPRRKAHKRGEIGSAMNGNKAMPNDLISEGQRAKLLENGSALQSGQRHISEVAPIVRLYDTCGNGEWLIAGLDPADEDVAIGLAASGRAGGLFYAQFRLSLLVADCERGGRAITRDRYFRPNCMGKS